MKINSYDGPLVVHQQGPAESIYILDEGADGRFVACMDQDLKTATQMEYANEIVRRVNAHDRMVAALDRTLSKEDWSNELVAECRAALAEAKGML